MICSAISAYHFLYRDTFTMVLRLHHLPRRDRSSAGPTMGHPTPSLSGMISVLHQLPFLSMIGILYRPHV